MKHKTNRLKLSFRLGIFLLPVCISLQLSAQEVNDSTHVVRDDMSAKPTSPLLSSPLNPVSETMDIDVLNPVTLPIQLPRFTLKEEIHLPYQTNPSLNFLGDFSISGVWKELPHGSIFGSGSQTSAPGIGRFNNASLGYQHIFNDKWGMQLSADAMKINMSHITGQAFSTSGTLFYHPSERVTLKFFGTYGIGNSYGMNTQSYGASVAVDMSERFGMEMGAQRYYDAMRGRWEIVPVVIPYYRFNKFTLGLDVGGILYEVLRDAFFDKGSQGGPTIGPPRFSIPIR